MELYTDEITASFETSKLALEKGFTYKTKNWWGSDKILNQKYDLGNTIPAPTQSLLQRWLRDEHNIKIVIEPSFACYNVTRVCKYSEFLDENLDYDLEARDFNDFLTYEEALEFALEFALNKIGDPDEYLIEPSSCHDDEDNLEC